jgi:MFS family permease
MPVPRPSVSPWAVLAAAIVVQAATAPGQTVGISVFVDHLVADLDISRSALSTAYLIGTLAGATVMVPAGRFIDRRGPRRAVAVFGVGFAVVLTGMAGVTGFVTLVAGFVGARALGQGALTLTATTSVAVGFERRRGTAIGIMSAAGSGLMSLVPLGAVALIAAVGWRWAWVVLAAGVFTVVVAVAAGPTLVRRPLPAAERVARPAAVREGGATVAEAMRSPAYWVVLAGVAATALVATGLTFHHIDLLSRRGLDATAAAANFLPQTVAGAAAALVVGHLADRASPRLLLAATLAGLAVAPVLVVVVRPGPLAVLYGVVLGGAASAIRAVEATVLPRWFGTTHIGEIRGVVMAATVGASALGPLALAAAADSLGTYTPALVAFTAGTAVLSVLGALVRPPVTTARLLAGGPVGDGSSYSEGGGMPAGV